MPTKPAMVDLPLLQRLTLGPLTVEPGLLEVAGPARRLTTEPRVMQVLVELVRADGRTVSRDQLVARCWGGAVISEDAINRAIAKLRTLLAAVIGDALVLHTIRGVGYRLAAAATPARPVAEVEPAFNLESRGLAAMFEGSANGSRLALHYLGLAVADRPEDALLWGSLAMAQVLALAHAGDDLMLVAARARETATRAQALQPGEGRSLAALAALAPTYGHWAAKEAQLLAGLAHGSGATPLLFQHVLFLAAAGRMAEAQQAVELAAASAPLLPWIQSARAWLLACNGDPAAAATLALAMQAQWPEDRQSWFAAVMLAMGAGRLAEALALAGDTARCPATVAPAERAFAAGVAAALVAGDGGAALLDGGEAAAADGRLLVEQLVLSAALLGDGDRALRWLGGYYGGPAGLTSQAIVCAKIGLVHPAERSTAFLFVPAMAAVRAAPGFGEVLAMTGLK